MISEDGLQKFIDMYERKYSIKLSKEEAFSMFYSLVNLVRISMSSEKNKQLQKVEING